MEPASAYRNMMEKHAKIIPVSAILSVQNATGQTMGNVLSALKTLPKRMEYARVKQTTLETYVRITRVHVQIFARFALGQIRVTVIDVKKLPNL